MPFSVQLYRKYMCYPQLQGWIKNYHLDFNPLSANPTKWPNTLKKFVGNLPTNSLSVLDHFVKLALIGLRRFCIAHLVIWTISIYLQVNFSFSYLINIYNICWSFKYYFLYIFNISVKYVPIITSSFLKIFCCKVTH